MKISVVIPSKNGLHHLKECLPTVIKAAQKSFCEVDITVVDDNSTDNTSRLLLELFPSIQVLQNPLQGACSARNWGVSHSKGEWLVFLDNDVFLEETFFDTLAKYLKPNIFCVTCAGYAAYPKNMNEPEQLDGIKLLHWKRGYPRFTVNVFNSKLKENASYLSWGVQGAYFACKRSKFEELGGFDVLLDPYLLEETDLAYRGLKRGWKITYAADTTPRHKCGGTINSKKSARTKFLSKRNRILFVWKNIHSKKLLINHIMWLVLSVNFKALFECIRLYPQIKQKRREEKSCLKVSDTKLFSLGNQIYEE